MGGYAPASDYLADVQNRYADIAAVASAPAIPPIFRALQFGALPPSTARLPTDLTINSITVSPSFRYCGEDADLTDWDADGYGDTLTLTGSGSDPTVNAGSPLLGADDAVDFNSGKRYEAGNNTNGDIGTEDYVIEMVFRKTATTAYMIDKRSTVNPGWYVATQSGSTITSYLASASVRQVYTAALTAGEWFHAMVFMDRSGSGQWYVNGTSSGASVDITAASGSISRATPLSFGARSADGAVPLDDRIAYAAMWKQSSWLDTHLQADIAFERFARLLGIYPDVAGGTEVPSVAQRSTGATLDKAGTTYYVSPNWMRSNQLVGGEKGYFCDPVEDDSLIYVGDDGNIGASDLGVIKCKTVIPASSKLGSNLYLWSLEDTATAADYIEAYADSFTGAVTVITSATAGSPGLVTGTTDICDGSEHTIAVTYESNSLKLYIDGAEEGTEDTTVTIPNSLDQIHIGEDRGQANQIDGIVWNFEIFDVIDGVDLS